jgi:hypothetical protein
MLPFIPPWAFWSTIGAVGAQLWGKAKAAQQQQQAPASGKQATAGAADAATMPARANAKYDPTLPEDFERAVDQAILLAAQAPPGHPDGNPQVLLGFAASLDGPAVAPGWRFPIAAWALRQAARARTAILAASQVPSAAPATVPAPPPAAAASVPAPPPVDSPRARKARRPVPPLPATSDSHANGVAAPAVIDAPATDPTRAEP